MKTRPLILILFVSIFLSGCTMVWRFPYDRPPHSEKRPNLFRGIFHVHSSFSHDSKASLNRILETAKRAGLDFVFVTDHNTLAGKQAYQAMNPPDWPKLIFANEISTNAGHVIALGVNETPPKDLYDAKAVVKWIHVQGGSAILAHPLSPRKPWTEWRLPRIDGIEIFSFPDIYYTMGLKALAPKAFFLTPKKFLNEVIDTPHDSLELWNEQQAIRPHPIPAFTSVDAHQRYEWMGFAPENLMLYFQAATTYVTAKSFTEEAITESLATGKSFMAFEARGIAQDFEFRVHGREQIEGPGATLLARQKITFVIEAPEPSHLKLIKNGEVIEEAHGTKLESSARRYKPGAFRAEAYRDGKLWIVTNPIYLE